MRLHRQKKRKSPLLPQIPVAPTPCNVPEGLNPDDAVSEKPKMLQEGVTSINIEIIFRKFCTKRVEVLKKQGLYYEYATLCLIRFRNEFGMTVCGFYH
ncbi:hypothetical protein [uncultured Marixanthomonas sp.]|uniref:hypothetical protein n=1 Tax=uncultured Marixanthomonas sp. TaxID=757245 RepID=UPI0030D8DF76